LKLDGWASWGKSSEQTIESEIPIRLHVKCSAYRLPPDGYRKSVKSRISGIFLFVVVVADVFVHAVFSKSVEYLTFSKF
jgi:hypothetical protein